jgi:hypothetical protein
MDSIGSRLAQVWRISQTAAEGGTEGKSHVNPHEIGLIGSSCAGIRFD